MMEDWTDIIAEELDTIEEPLPADDWSVLQQKYAASRRRKKAVFFAWSGGITSVAAAVALVLLLFRPEAVPDNHGLVADEFHSLEDIVPADTVAVDAPSELQEKVAPEKKRLMPAAVDVRKASDDDLLAENMEPEKTSGDDEIIEVLKDTSSVTERLIADASDAGNDDRKTDGNHEYSDYSGFDDFPDDEPIRRRLKMAVGMSGSASASPIIKSFDVYVPPAGDPIPTDSLDVENKEPSASPVPLMKGKKASYEDRYSHEIPKSIGVNLRVFLTERISINTGLNYTRYASDRTRIFSGYTYQNDRQYAHYIGIPLRMDWMIVNRNHFNFYLGAGLQADKCVYATVGEERLHEKQVLMGLNGAMGLQVNIVPMVGLYFEPEVSYSLNEGDIQTFRSRESFLITARAGLRFTF